MGSSTSLMRDDTVANHLFEEWNPGAPERDDIHLPTQRARENAPHLEKVDIAVDDAHFLAVEMWAEGLGRQQLLTFRTHVDDIVRCDRDHPLRFGVDPRSGGLKPYLAVRGRLEALLVRARYYDLVELAVVEPIDGVDQFGVWSGASFFAMAPASQVDGPPQS